MRPRSSATWTSSFTRRSRTARATSTSSRSSIEFKIRYRVDGALYEMAPPPRHLALPVISRVKVMANLNIAERRLPQDGRIQKTIAGRPVDLRVSTLPTQYGESVVLRVLDRIDGQPEPRGARDAGVHPQLHPAAPSRSRTASSSSPAPPAPARPPPSTPALTRSTPSTRSSSPPRTRSSTTSRASSRSRSTRASGSTSGAFCAPSSARTRTASWSARRATSRRRRFPSRPRSPATSSSPPCTPTTPPARSPASSTWASSRS